MDLFTSPSFWFDIICIVLFLMLYLRYSSLGFLAAVVQICGTVFSLLGANFLARRASVWIYENCLAELIEEKLAELIVEKGVQSAEGLALAVKEALPAALRMLWQDSWLYDISTQVGDAAGTIAHDFATSVAAPLVTQLLFLVLFLLSFVVLRVLVWLLVRFLKAANYLPVIGVVNRVLGKVISVVGSAIDLLLIVFVVWAIMLLSGNHLPFLNTHELADSFVLKGFQMINPFA